VSANVTPRPGWVRLRQVALVAHDLDVVVGALHDAYGLEVAHNDPAVAAFGLRNAVLPVGNQFIEVVSPVQEGTAGGRQLERLGGDGGYMVICHAGATADDHAAVRQRVADLGVRTVLDGADASGYHIVQLHPRDTGGSFLEMDYQPGGEDPNGPWMPAGDRWQQARRTDVVTGITGVVVESSDPAATAERWAALTAGDLSGLTLTLDNVTVGFAEGPLDTLVSVDLAAADPSRAGDEQVIGGVTFRLT
jgi:hypothetical protein